jgi:acetoin utilization deacetylase AcuC-like enzyme
MPAGCGDAEYSRVYREFVEPIGRAFDPELLLVSAGYDAGQHDPLAPMNVTPAGFAEIADACLGAAGGAARGRAVFALEGGYNMANLRDGTSASLRCLLGDPHERLTAKSHPSFDRLLAAFGKALSPHWPTLLSR